MSAPSASNGIHPTHDIPYLPLAYDSADSEATALQLVLTLFPEWKSGEGRVEFTRFKDGITNTLMKASKRRPGASDEQLDQEAVLLRAYGNGTEVLIDRQRETTSHSILAQHGLAPELLARFKNGLIYRFIRGKACAAEDLRKEPIWRGVAQQLAQWHALLPIVSDGSKAMIKNDAMVTLTSSPVLHPLGREKLKSIAPGIPVPNIWTVMQKWIFALPSETKPQQAKRDLLQQELERSAAELSKTPGMGGNGLVFAHCDLLSGNVIIPPSQSHEQASPVTAVSFIDYEYATPGPAAFDLANHFSEWGGFDCDYAALPNAAIRREFIREYVAHYAKYHDLPLSREVDYVSRLGEEIDRFRGIPGLYWGIWALIQSMISTIDFDYKKYSEVRLAEYFDVRAEQDGTRVASGAEKPLRERRWMDE